jgi:hypothetical protein
LVHVVDAVGVPPENLISVGVRVDIDCQGTAD